MLLRHHVDRMTIKLTIAVLIFCVLCAITACRDTGDTPVPMPDTTTAGSNTTTATGTAKSTDAQSDYTADTQETEAPQTTERETLPPETQAQDTTPPETIPPDTKPPETIPPETKAPETKAPETKAPETKVPETNPPETKAPETKAPETKPPETEAPATQAPETKPAGQAPQKPAKLDEAAIFTSAAITGLPMPQSPGTYAKSSDRATIDYSYCSEGYVTVKFTGAQDKNYVVRITAPGGTYYDYMSLPKTGGYLSFPLSEGSGTYSVTLYESRVGTKYAPLLSAKFDAALKNDFTAFLYPNYYVNYTGSSKAVKLAAHITSGIKNELDIIKAVYEYVVGNFEYDYELADRLSGTTTVYVPDLERLMAVKKGICFDYASLMTAMLRSRGIPSKLIFGYAGTTYHAWINVHTAEQGWINAYIRFDGKSWKLMDPTYASSSKEDPEIMKYIENGSDYKMKYTY